MRYFLKKSNTRKGVYLQVYYSVYNADKKQGRNYSYVPLGYYDELKKKFKDPIAYGNNIVEKLNQEADSHLYISSLSVEKNLGCFLLNSMFNLLGIEEHFKLMTRHYNPHYDFYSFFKNICFAQVISPGSKLKAYENVIPSIYGVDKEYSYDQILDGVNYIGDDYQKYIELLNHHIQRVFERDYSTVFFDCTNYYFEIDLEDGYKMKGPSKESRNSPIIGQALLLDANQIPLGMQMYPGNKSEKAYLREMIDDMKSRYDVKGRTIQVADKGLNCARNIYETAIEGNNGYIFSKSIHGKGLSSDDKEWIIRNDKYNIWTDVKNKDGKLRYRYKSVIDEYEYSFIDVSGNKINFTIKEKRVVTYNPSLAEKQKQEISKEFEKALRKTTLQAVEREEYGDSIKYVIFPKKDKEGNKIRPTINQSKIDEDRALAGYNLLVTSEINADERNIYEAYHCLWKIENSFRILKTYLEARPVFLQKKESVFGHFLICYYCLTLLRLLEKYIFNDDVSSEEIITFIRSFTVTKSRDGSYINNAKASELFMKVKDILGLSKLNSLYLTRKEIKNIFEADLPYDL